MSDEAPSPTSPSFSSLTATSPKTVDLSKEEEVKTVFLNEDTLLTLKNNAKSVTSAKPTKEMDDVESKTLNEEMAIHDRKVRRVLICHIKKIFFS